MDLLEKPKVKKQKVFRGLFVADSDIKSSFHCMATNGDADDDSGRRLLRRGIGNSRQMWTATWQAPTTARTTIVIFNIFIQIFRKNIAHFEQQLIFLNP